jgi:hypothetical protein
MPRVFIPNKSGHDFSDALRYCEGKEENLIFVSEGLQSKFSVAQMHREWEAAFECYGVKENDYIIESGLPLLSAIGIASFVRKFGKVNLLLWRSGTTGGKYIARTEVF